MGKAGPFSHLLPAFSQLNPPPNTLLPGSNDPARRTGRFLQPSPPILQYSRTPFPILVPSPAWPHPLCSRNDRRHLIDNRRWRGQRFGLATRREEGESPAVGLRPTSNNVAGTKIGRSGSLSAYWFFHMVSVSFAPNASAGICEMASNHNAGKKYFFSK